MKDCKKILQEFKKDLSEYGKNYFDYIDIRENIYFALIVAEKKISETTSIQVTFPIDYVDICYRNTYVPKQVMQILIDMAKEIEQ